MKNKPERILDNCQVMISEEGPLIYVKGPFNGRLNNYYRCRGGIFDEPSRRWILPRYQGDGDVPNVSVYRLLRKEFGWFPGCKLAVVDILYKDPIVKETDWSLHAGGYLLASRRYRDSEVEEYPFAIPDGSYARYGGSIKNPHVMTESTTVTKWTVTVYEGFIGLLSLGKDAPKPGDNLKELQEFTTEQLQREIVSRYFLNAEINLERSTRAGTVTGNSCVEPAR